jgi:hypothetical protein
MISNGRSSPCPALPVGVVGEGLFSVAEAAAGIVPVSFSVGRPSRKPNLMMSEKWNVDYVDAAVSTPCFSVVLQQYLVASHPIT